ncbi:hypothetical protein HDU84_000050 [Entophlyctis sp. JEL0112]|nr:hypothetical protein HDU84_000050 [Entophlyctis sp. JEL0112]
MERFYELWGFTERLVIKSRQSHPLICSRLQEELQADFLTSSFSKILGQLDPALKLIELTGLLELSSAFGLRPLVVSFALDLDHLLCGKGSTNESFVAFLDKFASVSKADEVVFAIISVLDAIAEVVDHSTLRQLLGIRENKNEYLQGPIGVVDRYLKIVYLGTSVPVPAMIQADLDAYFFDALEKKNGQASVQKITCLSFPRKHDCNCDKHNGILVRLLEFIIQHIADLTPQNALKISEVIGNLVGKFESVSEFEVVATCLEKLKEKLLSKFKRDTSIIVRELDVVKRDLWRIGEAAQCLGVYESDLRGVLLLVETARECLAALLVRGVV